MVIKYLGKYKTLFFTGIICVCLEAICDLLGPRMMAMIIDTAVKNGDVPAAIRIGLIMLGIILLGALFATVRNILAGRVSQSFGADLRYDIFEKIMNFSVVGVDKIDNGSLITRMTNDTAQITNFVNGIMRIFLKAPIVCIGSIVMAVSLSMQLSVILFSAVIIVSILITASIKMSYSRFSKVQNAVDRVNTVIEEYLLGIRLVKAFGRFSDEEVRFEVSNNDLAEKSVSSQLVIVFFSPVISLFVSLGIAAILFAGSRLFGAGEIEIGTITAFITYMTQILGSLIMITNVFNVFVRTKASTERINEILECDDDYKSEKNQEFKNGDVEFSRVTFSYPAGSGLPTLKNLSFKIEKDKTMAIIGPTGSGKSTIAWLLLHFYSLSEGEIKIGGVSISDINMESLRENIAIAPQKSMLFTGSIEENISYSSKSINRELVASAAKAVQAEEFINSIPENYDSELGQGGVNISGGQKQRISIARAILKGAPILILDDCTSALDAVTEARVRENLKNIKRTTILITQRISTAMFADSILVLENGVNAGFGSHDELLQTCGIYKEIYNSQIGE